MLQSADKQVKVFQREGIPQDSVQHSEVLDTANPKEIKNKLRTIQLKGLAGRLRGKVIHGTFAKQVEQENFDVVASHRWL